MKVFNTLTGRKEDFVPLGDEVKMYVCGINPYDDAHIGHAMSYIFFDVVRRYLEFRGYKVRHIQNVTDIEDNIIAHANRQGVSVPELTQKYVERYDEDMEALNVLPAHVYPRAMGEIDKMIEIIRGLIDKGYAYESEGVVYFRVERVPDYGKLSNRSLESMIAGARIDPGEAKENPMDFVLWKAAKEGEPSWESPWGEGRPGWHIECSAMSLRYLGEQIDIHGGGQDVVFPHHENEIAQSESFTGKKPFVKYWLHNGLLKLDDSDSAKMSRSLGNLITIREALEKYSPDAIRVFILSSYYRSPLTYSGEALEAAEKGADRLRQVVRIQAGGKELNGQIDIEAYRNRFIGAMDDDFGTAQGLAALFDLARDANRLNDGGYNIAPAQAILSELAGVLGLSLEFLERQIVGQVDYSKIDSKDIAERRGENLSRLLDSIESTVEDPNMNIEALRGYINLALGVRDSLRKEKQYQLADEIRTRLMSCGFMIEDTSTSPKWVYKPVKRA